MDIVFLIKDLIKTRDPQAWINRRFKDEHRVPVDFRVFRTISTHEGTVYALSPEIQTVSDAAVRYRLSEIRKDDIVIDIGANVGGFCIPAARHSAHVYAVEPMTTEELRRNIALNGADVTVIEAALGDGTEQEIAWRDEVRQVPTMTLGQLKEVCGGCDILKCHCEGAEWSIRPEELEGIRRIELAYHPEKQTGADPEELLGSIRSRYVTEWEEVDGHALLHARWVD
ncbi:FkbM family methyltransferase [Methanofollis aquaemaris]|uniref:FkbM family methyltransferase n=1 Tax=Methanofollis aquaemaris TaxID=126734 RepID=A0A8A3S7B0_9EURY|nr:FkbM family methyltransferase [Methanofollis aquaemaris]QSZ67922.1 FkbM family methyltransferase [Methanofollis aquaemaris]